MICDEIVFWASASRRALKYVLKGGSHYTNTVLSAEHVKVMNINKWIIIYA